MSAVRVTKHQEPDGCGVTAAEITTMHTTYESVRDGTRVDIEVELLATQTKTVSGEEVERLLVADTEDTEFYLVRPPEYEWETDVEPGSTLRVSRLLGVDPNSRELVSEHDCSHCDGTLRRGQVIDAVNSTIREAASRLDFQQTFGIVDDTASIYPLQEEEGRDDWYPMGQEPSIITPDYVCLDCGMNFATHELRPPTHSDTADSELLMENMASSPVNPADASMGLATGGAKDVTNFRENITNGYTPQPEAISEEGLFYDYYFETGEGQDTDALFSPRYATAVSEHPLSGETEQYLSVGLDSTLSIDEFERPTLDLVVVLDVSGSMSSKFDSYYYDEQGNKQAADSGAETKMEAATESLCALTRHLTAEDHLGVVLFNSNAHIAKPIRDVGSTDMDAIRGHIRDIQTGGGTNLADGFERAVDMLAGTDPNGEFEQRVVFMTDMMPNTGRTGTSELIQLFQEAANDGIHTTFIGMGLDTNAELADELTGIQGANQYIIHSPDEFEQRLDDEFEYMVTPLVYDLNLELKTEGYEIAAVHGSPASNATDGKLMHVGTLFPSAKQDGEARGGVLLVRLDQVQGTGKLELVASWTEPDGETYTEEVGVDLSDEEETYDHGGIRKAIVLTRYARQLRSWSEDIHNHGGMSDGVDDWNRQDKRGEHERTSVPLMVANEHATAFERLQDYLEAEIKAVDDPELQQEIDLLDTLTAEQSAVSGGAGNDSRL